MIKIIIYLILSLSTITYGHKIKPLTDDYRHERISISKYIGTPYKYGGNDLKGIDCSALIEKIYKDEMGIDIPRTSNEISKIGIEVDTLKLYDIMIFKHHVAMYLGNDRFIHATSSKGVIIDSIGNNSWNYYWKYRYKKSIRVES